MLKVCTFNKQYGVKTTKGYWQYATTSWKYCLPHQSTTSDISDIVKSNDIDILTLSEVDGCSFRSRYADQAEMIAKDTGMKHHFYPTGILELYGNKILNKGNAIISKYKICRPRNIPLTSYGIPRFLSMGRMKIEGKTVNVLNAHLSLGNESKKMQIKELSQIVKKLKGPVILTGDFNTYSKEMLDSLKRIGLRSVGDHKTFPSWDATESIDHILISDHFRIIDSYTLDKKISDHLPLVAELEFK